MLGRAAEFSGLVPRLSFSGERDGLLLTERGDAVVVVGQEPAISASENFPSSIATSPCPAAISVRRCISSSALTG